MGFSPTLLGLGGERITSPYGASRPSSKTKYHIGIDVSSSGKARSFRAGVYGTVVEPIGGEYGTITVVPFHNQQSAVQYLHCSTINVKLRQKVAPWTVLGRTGTSAPADSGVTGYHLHLHVIELGKPQRPTWPLNYVDPTIWSIGNPLIGQWISKRAFPKRGFWRDKTEKWTITDDTRGSAIEYESEIYDRIYGSNCVYRSEHQTRGEITSRSADYLEVHFPKGNCKISTDCDKKLPCSNSPTSGKIYLLGAGKLRAKVSGGRFWYDLKKVKVRNLNDLESAIGIGKMAIAEVSLDTLEDGAFT